MRQILFSATTALTLVASTTAFSTDLGKCGEYFDEAIAIAKTAGTIDKYMLALGGISTHQVEWMREKGFPTKAPVAEMSRTGNVITFDKTNRMEILDCASGKMKINGHEVQLDFKKPFLYNYALATSAFRSRKTASVNFFSLILPEAAATHPGISAYLDDWLDPRSWPSLARTDDLPTGRGLFSLGIFAVNVVGFAVSTPFTAASYVGHKVQSALAPSCSTQVQEFGKILKKNFGDLELKDLDCSGHVRTTDRSMTFTKYARDKKLYVDFDLGIAWFDPKHVYRFNTRFDKGLIEVRSLIMERRYFGEVETGKVKVLNPGSLEFDQEKALFSPYLEALQYLYENKSCYGCENNINSIFSTKMNGRGSATSSR